MDSMEDKLGAILNNPQMMQQIMALAQTMNQSEAKTPEPVKPEPPQPSGFDLNTLAKLGNLAKRGNIDREQQNLLRALTPYLSREKIAKLERAMHAAKMASMASSFLNAGGMQFLSGR